MMEDTAGPWEERDDRAQYLAPLPKRDILFWQGKELTRFLIIPALGAISPLCKSPGVVLAQLFLEGQLEIMS